MDLYNEDNERNSEDLQARADELFDRLRTRLVPEWEEEMRPIVLQRVEMEFQ